MHANQELIKAGCVQSIVALIRFEASGKNEEEFATVWLLCLSLAGQVRPMQTRCTEAVVTIKGKGRKAKVIFSKLCVVLLEQQTIKFLQRNDVY